MFWTILPVAFLVLMGFAYLKGKCDGLIAGYNTASREEQATYDIKRLRIVAAVFHFVLAGLFFLFEMKDAAKGRTIFLISLAALSVASVLLANSWAKKK